MGDYLHKKSMTPPLLWTFVEYDGKLYVKHAGEVKFDYGPILGLRADKSDEFVKVSLYA